MTSKSFVLRDEVDQSFRERRFAGVGSARDQNRFAVASTASASRCPSSAERAPASTSCCIVNQCGRNLRIVRVTPCNEQGGNAAATREPSGSRASSSGFASLMSLPERPGDPLDGVRQILRLEYCVDETELAIALRERSLPSPFTMTSETSGSRMTCSIGCRNGRMVSSDIRDLHRK